MDFLVGNSLYTQLTSAGSGKTHCMESREGIIPRIAEQLFSGSQALEADKVEIGVNFVEISNEQLNDLLSAQRDLQIRHESNGTTTVLKATRSMPCF